MALVLTACSGSSAHPAPVTVAPTTTVPVVPGAATIAPTFNAIMGATNQSIYAFAARLQQGVPADATVLPADLVALASAAATAFGTETAQLQAGVWPPALQPAIDQLVSDSKTFAADLELLPSGLLPSLLSAWQAQFTRDGAAMNAAEDTVRAMLGLPPQPTH